MSARRQTLLGAAILVGFVLLAKAGQVAMTPEFWDWASVASVRLVQSPAVKFLVVVATLLWCASLVALAWDKAERRHKRYEEERAAARQLREEMARDAMTGQVDNSQHNRGPRAA